MEYTLTIKNNGNLVLINYQGIITWSTNTT